MRWCAAGLLVVGVAAAVVVGYAVSTPMAGHKGEDEIGYYASRERPLQPGGAVEREVRLQGPGLSAVEIPYRSEKGSARVRIRVADGAGLVFQDHVYVLAATPPASSRLVYWAVNYWGAFAYYERVPISPPAGAEVLRVRLDLLPASPAVVLYANALDPDGQVIPYPAAGAPAAERIAIRTLYGPIGPAYAGWDGTARRMSQVGPPWLPYPSAIVLAAAFAALGLAAAALTLRAGAGDER